MGLILILEISTCSAGRANGSATFFDDVAESPCVKFGPRSKPENAFGAAARRFLAGMLEGREPPFRRIAACVALHCIQMQRRCWCST